MKYVLLLIVGLATLNAAEPIQRSGNLVFTTKNGKFTSLAVVPPAQMKPMNVVTNVSTNTAFKKLPPLNLKVPITAK